ncbi:MAG: molybdopterin biosynthesis protein [Bacillota bacterium]
MEKRQIYLQEIPLDEALAKLRAALNRQGAVAPAAGTVGAGLGPLPGEPAPTPEAVGRVLAEAVFARSSAPHYHASAMDGYAVQAPATFGASETRPARLRVGSEAHPVDTGDPLPVGTDAVIMIEDVRPVGPEDEAGRPAAIAVAAAAAPWQHVRSLGEDIVATELVLPANHTVRPVDVGALLAAGVIEVKVRRRPRVALIPTGTEIVDPFAAAGRGLKPGDILESNSYVQAALIREWGGEPIRRPIVPDRREAILAALEGALEVADVVVLNAGSSAGSEDFSAWAIGQVGEVLVHGVAIKPGRPVIIGVARGRPVIGIPGYPVSSFLTSDLVLKPLVYALQGRPAPSRPVEKATISRRVMSTSGAEEFLRVKLGRVGGRLVATPIARGAGVTMSLVRADGVVRIPPLLEGLAEGDEVAVELWRDRAEIEGTIVAIGSHDLCLDLLADFLRRRHPELDLSSAHAGSFGGLMALRRGEAHLAGVHLLDEETGVYNVEAIRKYLPGRRVHLVHLVRRDQGFLVAPGNPKGIKGFRDLVRPAVRFVNRQRGAGTRVLLDYHLKLEGIDPRGINGYEREEFTHLTVAAAVASGAVDTGLGILAAARALGLDFIPVTREDYDLAIPAEHRALDAVGRLLAVVASPEFRFAVAALGGYDPSRSGEEEVLEP